MGELPCTIKFIIEGEEETSSVHLHDFVEQNTGQLLAADACLWEFGGVDHREVPMQYLGLRGICYVELSVETARHRCPFRPGRLDLPQRRLAAGLGAEHAERSGRAHPHPRFLRHGQAAQRRATAS